MEALIARQPIFDRNNEVYAYELLYRNDRERNYFDVSIDPDFASTKTIINSFIEIGLEKLTSGRKAFVNCTEKLLISNVPHLLPSEFMVVEILENIKANPKTLEACHELKKAGYKIALDDFELSEDNEDFIMMADIIKVDFMAMTIEEIIKFVKYIRNRKDLPVKPLLLAEKIENSEMHELAMKLGFVYFQGYYFSKPVIITGRTLNPISINRMRVLAVTMKEDYHFSELADIIRQDVALSYRLLKLVNSAYFAFNQRVNNIQQALSILGTLAVRKWVALLCLAEANPDKTVELVRMSMIRAHFLEHIAPYAHMRKEADNMYIMGMFSLLDVIMECPMGEVLDQVVLESHVMEPLLKREGPQYELLKIIDNYEKGEFEEAIDIAQKFGISSETISSLYLDAVSWSGAMGI